MDNYFSPTIQGAGLQVLETVYIVRTTKNIETLRGRFQLLLERMTVLKKASTNRQYQTDVSSSVQKYKSMYFDRPLENQQLSAISKPNEFDIAGLYCEALLTCSKRFAEEQTNKIGALKSENARIKRKEKIAEKIQLAIEELRNNCSSSEIYSCTFNQLETLVKA